MTQAVGSLYFNLFGGVSGDMLVSSLYSLNQQLNRDCSFIEKVIESIPEIYYCEFLNSVRGGISGTELNIKYDNHFDHRNISDIVEVLNVMPISARAHDWAVRAFYNLAEAESFVHGCNVDEVHFHEVGATDSIFDIVVACALLDVCNVNFLFASPITVGGGVVNSAHGELPIPAPATQYLLNKLPTCGLSLSGERATPTGVALLKAWEVSFLNRDGAITEAVAYGLGKNDYVDRANFLRVSYEKPSSVSECLIELRTMVDDQTGENVGYAVEQLRLAGCIDAYILPVVAKKNRPGFEVVVIAELVDQQKMIDIMFERLGTLGVRTFLLNRVTLARLEESVNGITSKYRLSSDGAHLYGKKPQFDDTV